MIQPKTSISVESHGYNTAQALNVPGPLWGGSHNYGAGPTTMGRTLREVEQLMLVNPEAGLLKYLDLLRPSLNWKIHYDRKTEIPFVSEKLLCL